MCIEDERGDGLSKSAGDNLDSAASLAMLFFPFVHVFWLPWELEALGRRDCFEYWTESKRRVWVQV